MRDVERLLCRAIFKEKKGEPILSHARARSARRGLPAHAREARALIPAAGGNEPPGRDLRRLAGG